MITVLMVVFTEDDDMVRLISARLANKIRGISIMDIIKEIDVNKPLTKDQLDMLEIASNLPISYDNDSPEFTKEELAQFKRISEFRREEYVAFRLSMAFVV